MGDFGTQPGGYLESEEIEDYNNIAYTAMKNKNYKTFIKYIKLIDSINNADEFYSYLIDNEMTQYLISFLKLHDEVYGLALNYAIKKSNTDLIELIVFLAKSLKNEEISDDVYNVLMNNEYVDLAEELR